VTLFTLGARVTLKPRSALPSARLRRVQPPGTLAAGSVTTLVAIGDKTGYANPPLQISSCPDSDTAAANGFLTSCTVISQ
jgi:hypothetical protein